MELKFLPLKCTSLVQPLEQGIINSVKCACHRRGIDRLSLDFLLKRYGEVDIYQAMEIPTPNWKAIPGSTVVNCFRKTGCHNFEGAPGATASRRVDQEHKKMADDQALHRAW